jgi:hypothetical protein
MFAVFCDYSVSRNRARLQSEIQLSGSRFCQDIIYRSFDVAADYEGHAVSDIRGETIKNVMSSWVAFDVSVPVACVSGLNPNLGASDWPSIRVLHDAFNAAILRKQASTKD